MKMTDLKREHFPNGQTFSQKSLDQYIAAWLRVRKDFFTRYLLCLLGGMAAGFAVLMILQQGFVRIFLAMLCVMVAAMLGTKMTAPSTDALKEAVRKVALTRKDMRIAKRNLKNGTVAWEEKQDKIEAE